MQRFGAFFCLYRISKTNNLIFMKKNVFLLSLATLAGVSLLSSCLKNSSGGNNAPQAILSVLQASPDAPSLDLYYNTQKVASAVTYNQNGVTYAQPNNYKISLVNTSTGDTLNQITDSIQSAYYSLIVYDTAANRDIMLIRDQFEQTQDQSAGFVRFLQLAPGLQSVNVYMDSVNMFQGRHFADNLTNSGLAEFAAISSGKHSFYALSDQGDTLGTLKDITLSTSAYTIYLSGLSGRTDSLGIKLRAMQNF